MDILVTRDTKNKIRVIELNGRWNDEDRGYYITRTSYLYGGKRVEQPSVFINQGKAKRTVTEQYKLEYKAYIKKYQDKGYKLVPNDIDINDYTALDAYLTSVMPSGVTDANGFKKHMLAKQADSVATKTFDSIPYWYASRKIDGCRISLYWQDDHIETASRGGQKYKSIDHIIKHPKLINFFRNHPDIILDGEAYKHGLSLQQISGLMRQEKSQSPIIEYYIYDIMDGEKTFSERLELLNMVKEELDLGFDPEKDWQPSDLKLQMVPHEQVTGWLNIEKLHNRYVKEGWEGLVIRDPDKVYNFGGRDKRMLKVKQYKDAEFTITGLSEGLRDEDMCFTLITDDGIEFKAKPMGSREIKEQYRRNIYRLVGKKATVKYFYYSDEGTPLQPVLKCIRDYE